MEDAQDEAHKRYNKNIRTTKPDLLAYERQKESAMGLAPGTLVPLDATSSSLAIAGPSSQRGLTASEDLYRGADTLSYGDSKPSEDAVDRVVGKINKEYASSCMVSTVADVAISIGKVKSLLSPFVFLTLFCFNSV